MAETEENEGSTLRGDAQRSLPFAALSGALQILLSVVGMLLLVRYLSPEIYGKWAVLMGFAAPVMLFTSLGFRHSLLRFSAALESDQARCRFLWSVLFRRCLTLLVVCIVLFATFPFYESRFGVAGQGNVFALMLPAFLFLAASQYLVIGLNVALRQREVFIGSLIFQGSSILGVLLGIRLEESLPFFAGVYLVANLNYLLFNFSVGIYFLGRPKWQDLTYRHQEDSEETHYRRTSFVDDLGNSFLSADVSRFILAAFSSSPQVAIYSVASNITEKLRALIPLEIFRPLTTVLFFRRYEETGTISEVNRMFHLLLKLNRILTTAFLVLFIPLGYEVIVWIFRADYGPAYFPVVALLIGIGLFGMPIGLVAQTLKRPQWLVYSKLAVFLNVGLGIPLAIHYGALGMASAMALSELMKNLIVYVLLRREFPISYPWLSTLQFAFSGISVALLLWLLKGSVHFLIAGGIGTLAWLAAIRLFRILSSEDRELLSGVAPERFRRGLQLLLGN